LLAEFNQGGAIAGISLLKKIRETLMKRLLAIVALIGALSTTWVNLASAQDQILGEVRLFGFNWCPVGWAPTNGATMQISQNAALFSLLGTNFGGNGSQTFALPNLSGRAPVGQAAGGVGQPFATAYGAASVTLIVGQMPQHTHQLSGSSVADSVNSPAGAILGTGQTGGRNYAPSGSAADKPMAANAIGMAGQNQPVATQSPALAMNWCVAVVGIYPQRP
jgi:microcystin-dependent protein